MTRKTNASILETTGNEAEKHTSDTAAKQTAIHRTRMTLVQERTA